MSDWFTFGTSEKGLSSSESPRLANTFLNDFLRLKGQYPTHNFHTLGWIHSINKMWWCRMIRFVLSKFEAIMKDIGLYGAVRIIQYGLPHSAYHLVSVLEMYHPKSGIFFTLVGELSFALHEIFEAFCC